MTAKLVQVTNPFRPTINRIEGLAIPGKNLRWTARQKGLIVNGRLMSPFIISVNGKVVLQKHWGYKIRDNDLVIIQHLPKGGGGSNPLKIVAMLAIVVASFYTGGAAGAAFGTVWGSVASAAVMIGGSMLLNMMFKPPSASLSGLGSSGSASPTYSLSAQGNRARVLESIPVLYGREKITPDYAAAPYAEMQGSDQYLYQLFMLSQGEVSIEKIMIGDTDISSYEGVQTEIINPYQPVTLFPTNVVTSTEVASQQLKAPDDGGGYIGPFVASAANTTSNYIAVDISIPGGLFRIDDAGKTQPAQVRYIFEMQQINAQGGTIGGWQTIVDNTVNSSSRDAVRLTHKVQVAPARYQVRGQRMTVKGSTQTSDALYWDGLKAFLNAPTNYGNCTMLAIVMKATNQLSSASSHNINVIATRKLKTWDPVNGWSLSTTPSVNPAWAAADMLKDPTYGRGMTDSQFNLQRLYQLAQTFDQRNDKFNYYYDTQVQLWEALKLCLKVARTIPIYYAGMIEFVRNEPQTIPKQMFQPDNMIANSFTATYSFAEVDTPDFVRIQFRNETTFQNDSVDCILPGGTANKPADIQLPGCTNREQAWREGITMAAINQLQRRVINFSTELEGLLPGYNDLCQLSHDSVGWAESGRVTSLNPATGMVQLSRPVSFNPGETHVIAFRRRDGSPDGPYTVIPAPNSDPTEIIITGKTSVQLSQIYISDTSHDEPTMFQFGAQTRAGLLAVMSSAQPQGDGTVTLSFVNYDANVFAAENGGVIPAPPPVSTLPKPPQLPIIDKVSLEYTYAVGQQTIVCTPANGASYYEYQASPDNGTTWIKLGNDTNPQLNVALNVGTWLIRVRAIGALAGPWTTISVDVSATVLPLCEIATLAATSIVQGVTLTFTVKAANGGMPKNIELWHGLSPQLGNAVRLAVVPATNITFTQNDMGPGETHYYFARVVDQANRPGPWFNNGTAVVGQSSSDAGKILDYIGGKIDETMLAQELQAKIDSGGGAATSIQQINDKINAMILLKAQGVTSDGKTVVAGIGIGVESGASDIILMANRVSICDPNNVNSRKYPFIVVGGVVYIDTAFIQDASITNAKIGGVIQSNVVNAQGQPLWVLDKNGTFQFASNNGAQRMVIDSQSIHIWDSAGTLRVAMGLNI
jgi:predicted phage tail protein